MDKLSVEVSPDGMVQTLYSEGDDLHVTYQQDAEPIFEMVQRARQEKDLFREGVKRDLVHAFHIPNGVVMELHKLGISVYKDSLKDIVRGLHKLGRYDACRLTDKRFV